MSSNGTGQTVSLTTSFRTVTSTLPSSTTTATSEVTSSSVITTSIPPSTTTEIPTSSSIPIPSSSAPVVTSTFTPAPTNATQAPSVVVVTSTLPAPTPTPEPPTTTSSASTSSSTSSSPSALSASGSGSSSGSGLSTGAKIAIAVVIPVVVVAALIIFGLWFWRKRKARKSNEELRKNEMAEYGFNPNHDPSLASAGVVGAAAGAAYGEDASDAPEDRSGYRGWGATSSNRKASTTLGSNGRPHGNTISDSGSQPGGYYQGSSPATNPSDHYSGDPLMHGHPEHGDGVGALGAGAAGMAGAGLTRHRSGNNGEIKRGPSNASSAYSNGPPRSEVSSDVPGVPNQYYGHEVPYNEYNDAAPQHGPYGDGSYGGAGGQPVIRDVQARRNTRIERAPTMPQTQGGIAQNF